MVTVADIAERLALKVLTRKASLNKDITGGYASDLLGCVMARAQAGNIWVTLQAHPNVVAVATLLNLSGVIVAEGNTVGQPTIDKAEEEGIAILSTPSTTYTVVERLGENGVHGIG